MTLSDDRVIEFLSRHFEVGKRNIKGKERYAGSSNVHRPENPAKWVNNCAGSANIQMFFMTSDGRVILCLPGYWGPKHFLHEAQLAVDLGKLYYDRDLSVAQRNEEYLNRHLRHAYEHSRALVHDSGLQGFDRKYLLDKETTDFKRTEGFVAHGLKTPDQVIHERMAEAPFPPFESFEVKAFIDMGTKHYSYSYGLEKEMGCKCGKTCGCGDGCKCAPSSKKGEGE